MKSTGLPGSLSRADRVEQAAVEAPSAVVFQPAIATPAGLPAADNLSGITKAFVLKGFKDRALASGGPFWTIINYSVV